MAAYGYKVALLFACALNITGQLYNYLAYYMAVFTHNTVAILANIAARQLRSTSAGYAMGPGTAENNACAPHAHHQNHNKLKNSI